MASQRTTRVSPRTSSRPSPSLAGSAPSSVRRSRPRSSPTPSPALQTKPPTGSRTASTAASSCSLAWRWGSGLDWRRSSGSCRLRSVSHDFPFSRVNRHLSSTRLRDMYSRMQPLPYFPPSNDTQTSRFVAIDCARVALVHSSAPASRARTCDLFRLVRGPRFTERVHFVWSRMALCTPQSHA